MANRSIGNPPVKFVHHFQSDLSGRWPYSPGYQTVAAAPWKIMSLASWLGRLVKYVVSENGVDHVAHGDGQSGGCDIEGPHLQSAALFKIGPFIRVQAGQLKGSKGANHVVRANHVRLAGKDALGQEFVNLDIRVRTAILDHVEVEIQI